MDKVLNYSLKALLNNVYMEGYACGINDERWLEAYVATAKRIILEGIKFSDKLVGEEYDKICKRKGFCK